MAAALDDPKKPSSHKKFKVKPGRWQLHLGNSNSNSNSNANSNSNSNPYTRKLRKSMTKMNKVLIPRIRINEKIIDADAGIYTWIIKGIENSTLYATRIFTKQEIGTLHLDLDRQTTMMGDTRKIIGAGELKVSPGETPLIQFNLQSGTYTKDIIDYHKIDMSLLFPEPMSKNDEDKHGIWIHIFGEIQQDKIQKIIDAVQIDSRKIIECMKKHLITPAQKRGQIIMNKPEDSPFTKEEIEELLRKNPKNEVFKAEISKIQQRIKNRIILYKRDRMIEFITRMFCSIFKAPTCKDVVQFRESTKSDTRFIKRDDAGKEFEVTAGKSLIVGAKNLSRANDIEQLSRYFKIKNNAPASVNNALANINNAPNSINNAPNSINNAPNSVNSLNKRGPPTKKAKKVKH
jgi:hypothetical protein